VLTQTEPHFVIGLEHAKSHAPLLQIGMPPAGAEQTIAQFPQLATSFMTLRSQPDASLPSQSAHPAVHPPSLH
jgi:hypothetical protein